MAGKKKKTIQTTKSTKIAPKKSSQQKKVTQKSTHEEYIPITTPIESSSLLQSDKVSGGIKKSQVIILLAVIAIIALLYVFRSQFVVATVNGQTVSRTAFNTELQKEAGQKSMDALVTKMLILQEANNQHISVSDQEVNNQINSIQDQLRKQGQSLPQALKAQGLTMEDLKEQVKIEKLIEKMLAKSIQVSDKEVNDYLAKMQQQPTPPDGISPTPTPSKDQVKNLLKQQKLSEKFQPWLQNLHQKAKISYFISY